MGAELADQAEARADLSSRWLRISLGEKKSAVRLEALIRVLDGVELFRVPLLPEEFEGIIYYEERAVPILNWKVFGIEIFLNPLILILEQEKDLIGIGVEGTGKVEEYRLGSGAREDGFWIELDSEEGVWGIDENKLFKILRQGQR